MQRPAKWSFSRPQAKGFGYINRDLCNRELHVLSATGQPVSVIFVCMWGHFLLMEFNIKYTHSVTRKAPTVKLSACRHPFYLRRKTC